MNWSARGNVLNQYLRNTSIGTTVIASFCLALIASVLINIIFLFNLILVLIRIAYHQNWNSKQIICL